MTIFEKTGPVNTEETLNIALKTAKERNLDIVVASSEGDTALSLMQKAKETGFAGKIVCVSCAMAPKHREKTVFLRSAVPHSNKMVFVS